MKWAYDVIDARAGEGAVVEELLSVSIHRGVVPRSSMTDDEPRADDLSNYKRVRRGDLVVNRMRAFQGAVGLAGTDGIVSPDYLVLRPRAGTEPRYLHHLFRSGWFVGEMIARLRGIGSTEQGNVRTPRINAEDLGEIRAPLVEPAAQRAIADYLDTETTRIDALIAKKRRMIELLDERHSQQLSALLCEPAPTVALRRLFVPPIGGSWGSEASTLGVDALCIRGTDFDMDALLTRSTAPVRSYSPSDFASKSLRKGDLIIEKSGGGDNQPVGRVVAWDGNEPAVPTNFAARLRPLRPETSRYLCLLLNAAYRAGMTRSWIKQTTGIQNLDLSGLLSEKVPFPAPDRRARLMSMLEESASATRALEGALASQLDLLAEHRQALITAAVTGELKLEEAA